MLSNPNVHYRLQTPPPPSTTTSSHISILLFKKHFNIIVQYMRRRSKSAPAFRGFQPKFCIRFFSFPSVPPALEYFIRTANTFHCCLIVSFPVWTFRLRLQQIYDTDLAALMSLSLPKRQQSPLHLSLLGVTPGWGCRGQFPL